MKILQVNCVYNKGSTGKIMYDVHNVLLENGIDSVILYGRGEKTTDRNVYKTCSELYSKLNNLLSRFTGLMYGGLFFSTNKLISKIKKEKPDIVHLHCINGYFVNIYRLISFLKKSGIKTVLTLHAEFMHTANCGHAYECEKWKSGCGKCPRLRKETGSYLIDGTGRSWKKMKKAFDTFNDNLIVTSVSPWLMGRAVQSPILSDKRHVVVMNGLDTEIFKIYDTQDLREKHGIKDEKVVFHATPVFSDDIKHQKGGYYVIELAKKLPNVKFIVAGNYTEGIKVPDNMILLGRVSNQTELAKYYSMADLTVITGRKETFSMILAESMACGTPVVGFFAGGPETIAIKDYSDFAEFGDVEALYALAKNRLDIKHNKAEISQAAHKAYAKAVMTEGYVNTYKEMLG